MTFGQLLSSARKAAKKQARPVAALLSALALVGVGGALLSAQGPGGEQGNPSDIRPNGRGRGTMFYSPHGRADLERNGNRAAQPASSGNGIYYHGGPVISGGVNVYYIWYGGWCFSSSTCPKDNLTSAQLLLNNLANSIDVTVPAGYFNIESTYYYQQTSATAKIPASNVSTYKDFYQVNQYPAGSPSYAKSLSDNDILAIVASAIKDHWQTADPNGVYFVLTSSDVTESSGFCSYYCAWHWSTIANGTANITTPSQPGGVDVKYGFVGNPARCPTACEAQTKSSPNNDPGVDGMADSIAHELEEAVTDPDGNAWYDRSGNENADKCAWTYGTTSKLANGSFYNITLGPTKYLLQRNWVNANGGVCAMKYP